MIICLTNIDDIIKTVYSPICKGQIILLKETAETEL